MIFFSISDLKAPFIASVHKPRHGNPFAKLMEQSPAPLTAAGITSATASINLNLAPISNPSERNMPDNKETVLTTPTRNKEAKGVAPFPLGASEKWTLTSDKSGGSIDDRKDGTGN